MNQAQRKFVWKLFGESYRVLGIPEYIQMELESFGSTESEANQ